MTTKPSAKYIGSSGYIKTPCGRVSKVEKFADPHHGVIYYLDLYPGQQFQSLANVLKTVKIDYPNAYLW